MFQTFMSIAAQDRSSPPEQIGMSLSGDNLPEQELPNSSSPVKQMTAAFNTFKGIEKMMVHARSHYALSMTPEAASILAAVYQQAVDKYTLYWQSDRTMVVTCSNYGDRAATFLEEQRSQIQNILTCHGLNVELVHLNPIKKEFSTQTLDRIDLVKNLSLCRTNPCKVVIVDEVGCVPFWDRLFGPWKMKNNEPTPPSTTLASPEGSFKNGISPESLQLTAVVAAIHECKIAVAAKA
jgi:hypothetical protein